MATPIKPTPIITDPDDIKRFYKYLDKTLNPTPKEREERRREYEKGLEMYDKLVKFTDGVFY